MAMTANEMVRDLIDNYGYTKYRLAKLGLASETMVRNLYDGDRGRYIRVETIEKVRKAYVRLTGKLIETAQNNYTFSNMEEFLLAAAELAKPEIEASYRNGVSHGVKTERARCLKLWESSVEASVIVEQIKKGKRLKREAKKVTK